MRVQQVVASKAGLIKIDRSCRHLKSPNPLTICCFYSRPDAATIGWWWQVTWSYVLELGRNKFEGPVAEFDDLEKAFWV